MATTAARNKLMTGARPVWRCFHCDEVFTDVKAARLHFGEDQDYEPGCIARVPDEERVLLEKIRELECELALFYDEDGPKDRQMQIMASEHRSALVGAEEAGYDKGVRDMAQLNCQTDPLWAAKLLQEKRRLSLLTLPHAGDK